jgi:aminoglycoside phosphotransferase (APT) family kinase protein
MALRLSDGTVVAGLSRPPQGIKHRVLFGVEEGSGDEVVAKVELMPGGLELERRALELLTEHAAPAPRLRATGTVEEPEEYAGALCLVTDRVAGEPPPTTEGWGRMGRALARLSRVPWEGSGLATLGHDEFLALHERRVGQLGEAVGRDLARELPPVPAAYATAPLTLTHGDPGPGNFLDDGGEGTIIDWEDAHVAPRGLDLGRATFIALLGGGPEGYEVRDQAARAAAARAGYLDEADSAPDEDELAWWLSVAGVQFAYWRLERAGSPGVPPWTDAVAVLESVR